MTSGLLPHEATARELPREDVWQSPSATTAREIHFVTPITAPARLALAPVDLVSLAYLAIAMVILSAHLVGWREGQDVRQLVTQVLLAHLTVGVLALAAPSLRRSSSSLLAILGDWYPLMTMMLLYASVGVLNRGIGDGRHFDDLVMQWDRHLFGRDIAYTWMRAEPSTSLSWMLHACYLAYFPLLIVGPIVLWCRGSRTAARRAIFATTLAFLACYAMFLLFPVAGPAYIWPTPDSAAAGVWPARAARALFFRGDAWGSGFPSAHVATSLVATTFAVRGWRPLAWLTVPPTLGILGAVVYSQIHYGTDAVAGFLLALLVVPLVWRIRCCSTERAAARI